MLTSGLLMYMHTHEHVYKYTQRWFIDAEES